MDTLERIRTILNERGWTVYKLSKISGVSQSTLSNMFNRNNDPSIRQCLKNHSRHLHAPLCGIFAPNSVSVAHYASFIGDKSPTKCDAQLSESIFQTLPRA